MDALFCFFLNNILKHSRIGKYTLYNIEPDTPLKNRLCAKNQKRAPFHKQPFLCIFPYLHSTSMHPCLFTKHFNASQS